MRLTRTLPCLVRQLSVLTPYSPSAGPHLLLALSAIAQKFADPHSRTTTPCNKQDNGLQFSTLGPPPSPSSSWTPLGCDVPPPALADPSISPGWPSASRTPCPRRPHLHTIHLHTHTHTLTNHKSPNMQNTMFYSVVRSVRKFKVK